MQSEYLVMGCVTLISLIANNYTVATACGILFFLRLFHADQALGFLEKYGLTAGIVLLTMGVLAPVAAGKIHIEQFKHAFISPLGIVAVLVGTIVAYFAGKGVLLLKNDPLIIAAVIVGTIIGVALFRGVAVGPLIAAGITAILSELFKVIK